MLDTVGRCLGHVYGSPVGCILYGALGPQPARPHGPPASHRGRRPSSPTSGGPGPVDEAERPPGKCVGYRSRFGLATARRGHIAREAATSPGNGLLVVVREQPEGRTAASRRRESVTAKIRGHLTPHPSTRVAMLSTTRKVLPTWICAVVMQNA
jgi:hypothetical protein